MFWKKQLLETHFRASYFTFPCLKIWAAQETDSFHCSSVYNLIIIDISSTSSRFEWNNDLTLFCIIWYEAWLKFNIVLVFSSSSFVKIRTFVAKGRRSGGGGGGGEVGSWGDCDSLVTICWVPTVWLSVIPPPPPPSPPLNNHGYAHAFLGKSCLIFFFIIYLFILRSTHLHQNI